MSLRGVDGLPTPLDFLYIFRAAGATLINLYQCKFYFIESFFNHMHLRQLGTKGTKGLVTDRNANIMIIFRSTTKKIRLRGGEVQVKLENFFVNFADLYA